MNRIRIREIVRKEFIQLFRDRKNRPILFIMPFVQLLIFGYVVSTDVRDVKVGLLDQSRTQGEPACPRCLRGEPHLPGHSPGGRSPGAGGASAAQKGGHRHQDRSRLQRAHPQGRDGGRPGAGRREHEQPGGGAGRLHDAGPRETEPGIHPAACPPADRLRPDRRAGPHVVQPEPGKP